MTMASDLETRLMEEKEEEMRNLCGVPECLVDMNKEMVSNGGGIVDNVDAISPSLALEVKSKAFRLLVSFVQAGYSTVYPGHGQAGLIRQEAINTSPGLSHDYAAIPVTAKHNIRRLEEFDAQPNPFMLLNESHKVRTTFQDTNYSPSFNDRTSLRTEDEESRPANWQFGVDIALGDKIGAVGEFFTKKGHSFATVSKGFQPMKGVKVGIAVLFTPEAKPTRKSIAGVGVSEVDMKEKKIAKVYGHPNVVNIYTGKIKYVGTNHIEYDFNSFTGCSGAVVFLLDRDQPASVDRSDYGKAVAIHAGGHPVINGRNIGFLLSSVLPVAS
jgi:hypothetical protein